MKVWLSTKAQSTVFKSRGVEILVKRLRRVVQATRAEANFWPRERLVCGKLVLRPKERRAYWNGGDLGPTLGEYKIVHLLASNAGRCVANRAIDNRLHYEGFIAGAWSSWFSTECPLCDQAHPQQVPRMEFQEIKNYSAFGYCWGKPNDTG
jgi:two-component system, OmpR family, response regulator ChvI